MGVYPGIGWLMATRIIPHLGSALDERRDEALARSDSHPRHTQNRIYAGCG
jgi:hypothetical protein